MSKRNQFGELIVSCWNCDKIRMDMWGSTIGNKGCGAVIRYWCEFHNKWLKTTPTFIEPCESFAERIGDIKQKGSP